jgi:protein N-terminal amidase
MLCFFFSLIADLLQRSIAPGSLDLLVLPEMALTGYIFSNRGEIEHLLEDPYSAESSASPSLQLAKQLAIRLGCYVVIGFPMRRGKVDSKEKELILPSVPFDARAATAISQEGVVDSSQICHNAALLVDGKGQLLHTFLKHFSYENDKTWAHEGHGFQSIDLPGLGKVCIAICMDLNRE